MGKKSSQPEPTDRIIPNRLPLPMADRLIARHGHLLGTLTAGQEFLAGLTPKELTILRQATLRAHRKATGPVTVSPTIRELDAMIGAIGPVAAENQLRKAVDEKRGEYDRGRISGTSNDAEFIERAKKI